MIKLHSDLMELVRGGSKHATTRKGVKNYSLGDTVLADSEDLNCQIPVKITGLELVTKRYLSTSPRIAKLENYDEPQGLVNKIEEIYGELADDQEFTVVHFKIL